MYVQSETRFPAIKELRTSLQGGTPGPEATGAVPSPASQPGVRGGGDASQTTVNGTTAGVGVPSPSGLVQPIGDGIQQTMMDA